MATSMLQTYAMGFDYGNSDTCAVALIGGSVKKFSMPTAVSLGDPRTLASMGVLMDKDDFVLRASEGGLAYYVGNLALSQGMAPDSERGNVKRYEGENALRCLLVAAVALVGKKQFRVQVVTGLPVETYKQDEEARARIRARLDGRHTFLLNEERYTVEICVERVLPEGAGAILSNGSKDRALYGVIDVGGRTTDLYVSNGLAPVIDKCVGIPLGVETAADLMAKNVSQAYRRLLKPYEVRSFLRAYAGGGTKSFEPICQNGKEIELVSFAEAALDSVGNQILSFVSSRWNSNEMGDVAGDFRKVLHIGGGAHYFFLKLKTRIPHLELCIEPEYSNALGYATMAASFLARNVTKAS